MARIFAKHEPYEDGHLGEVTADMQRLGSPTIRCIWYDGDLFALEGSHRLAACHHLGLTPLILIEKPDVSLSASAVTIQKSDRGRTPAARWPTLPFYDMAIVAMSAAIGEVA